MTDHEKRIRERIHGDDSLYKNVRNGDLRALLADLDAMRGALEGAQSLIRRHKESIRKDLDWGKQEEATEVMGHIRAALKGASHD